MPVFPKPRLIYEYNTAAEKKALRAHARARKIPSKSKDHALIATWNIANLGAQHRRDSDLSLIAEILKWFDIIAVQEERDNFLDLAAITNDMGSKYAYVMSDSSGNNERMAFIYDSRKFDLSEEIGCTSLQYSSAQRASLFR